MLKLGNIGNLVTYDSKRERMISNKNIELIINDGKIIEMGTKLGDADYFLIVKINWLRRALLTHIHIQYS